jgi:hypothetical protein
MVTSDVCTMQTLQAFLQTFTRRIVTDFRVFSKTLSPDVSRREFVKTVEKPSQDG